MAEDEAAMAYIREQWVGEQMTQRMDEFTVEQRVSVFAGTWNVNGKKAENAGASLAPRLPLSSIDRLPTVLSVACLPPGFFSCWERMQRK